MGKRFDKYKANHDLGPRFTFKTDGVGGMIFPNKAMARLKKNGAFNAVLVDGIPYPFVTYEGKVYPIVKTPQGWTLGGKHAVRQHAKNVAAARKASHSPR